MRDSNEAIEALLRIKRRYERHQQMTGNTPCSDSQSWGLPWAMYQDACEALEAMGIADVTVV